jgi:hypothetical protein
MKNDIIKIANLIKCFFNRNNGANKMDHKNVKYVIIIIIIFLAILILKISRNNKSQQSYLKLKEEKRVYFVKAGEVIDLNYDSILFRHEEIFDFICLLTRRKLDIKPLSYDEPFVDYVDEAIKNNDGKKN